MGRFFNYDNGVMQFLSKLADCMILSFFWLLCSIPIFTIGASTTALYYAVNKSVRYNRSYAWKEFWNGFKTNFKQSTLAWLFILLAYILGIVDCYILYVLQDNIPYSGVLLVVILAFMLFLTMWSCYILPYIARFENPLKRSMKNCLIIMIANLPWSILLVLLFAVAAVAFVFVPVLSIFVPVLYLLVANRILERIFRKYMSIEDLRIEEERNQEYYKELHVDEVKEKEEK